MTTILHVACCWSGLEPDGEHEITCDRFVLGFAQRADGQRFYACEEHVAEAKARASSGEFHHLLPPPYHEGDRPDRVRETITIV